MKKIFEAYFKYGIKCLFSLDFTYAFYYYSLFMYEVDLFLGYFIFLEILCIVYFFFILFVYLYLIEKWNGYLFLVINSFKVYK